MAATGAGGGAASWTLNVADVQAIFEDREHANLFTKRGGLRGIAAGIGIDPKLGATTDSIQARREAFGENRIPERPSKTYLQLLWAALQDVTLWLLCGAALVSIVLCIAFEDPEENLCYIEGIAICVTVLFVLLVNSCFLIFCSCYLRN